MRKKMQLGWLIFVSLLFLFPVANAENEKLPIVDARNLLLADKISLYVYTGSYVDMNEEKFKKGSCIFTAEDRKGISSLVQMLAYSKFKKSDDPSMQLHQGNEYLKWSSSYLIEFEYSDGSLTTLILGSENTMRGVMSGYYKPLKKSDSIPVVAPDLFGYSLRFWAAMLTKPEVTTDSTKSIEQCERLISKSVFVDYKPTKKNP